MPNPQTKPYSDPGSGTPFHTGDRVAIGGRAGVITAAFPDGFNLVRLDATGETTGAHFSQLASLDNMRNAARP